MKNYVLKVTNNWRIVRWVVKIYKIHTEILLLGWAEYSTSLYLIVRFKSVQFHLLLIIKINN